MSQLLRGRYYIGEVVYKGAMSKGRHEPIIDRDLFNAVQEILDASGKSGERKRVHQSYLKGSLWCGECYAERGDSSRRMIIQRAVGRTKAEYFYFFCRGRQKGTARPGISRSMKLRMLSSSITGPCGFTSTSLPRSMPALMRHWRIRQARNECSATI